MSNLTHYIDGTQVLSRAEILVQYKEDLTPANIQYFLETKKPTCWVSAKNKYWYSKSSIEHHLAASKKLAKPLVVEVQDEVWAEYVKSEEKKRKKKQK